jgi:nucleoside-diphosphate-sugar epimerase
MAALAAGTGRSQGMSRVVVIGATGHIGSYLVPRLIRGGQQLQLTG